MTWNLWWRFGPRWQARQPGIVRTSPASSTSPRTTTTAWPRPVPWRSSPPTRRSAELATDPALDGPAPVLVAGDLNADIDSPVLRAPLTDVLTDAYTTGGGEVGRDHRGSGGQRAVALIRS
jgi:hypothetical protein